MVVFAISMLTLVPGWLPTGWILLEPCNNGRHVWHKNESHVSHMLPQLLALELLKVLLENSGPTFRSNERFTAGQCSSNSKGLSCAITDAP